MREWLLALAIAIVATGCGDDGTMMSEDAGMDTSVPDDASPPDAMDTGADIDPTAVSWALAEEPAAGPLGIWAFIAAPIDAERTLIFGGTNASEVGGTTFDTTWLYDTSSGELVATEIEASGPAPRYCGCAGWDPVRERMVLTGGRDLSSPISVPAETWELDLEAETWTEVPVVESPPGVIGCMMSWSADRGAMYAFGGASGAGASDVMYRYDPAAPAWIALDASGPSARYDGILTPLDDETLLLFGGSLSAMGAAFFSDVWRFDTTDETWTEITIEGEVPAGRRVPWFVLTEDRAGAYLSMGFDGRMQPIGDFWYLDLAATTWTALTLPPGLTARSFTHHLPGPGALGTMLSGYDGSGPVREVWRLTAE